MKKSKSKLLELAAALEDDFSANDDKQMRRVTVTAGDGVYRFAFEQEGMSFQIKSKGVHFQDQPIDCATSPVTASIKITYFDGLND